MAAFGRKEHRRRLLPARVMVYFVLGPALFVVGAVSGGDAAFGRGQGPQSVAGLRGLFAEEAPGPISCRVRRRPVDDTSARIPAQPPKHSPGNDPLHPVVPRFLTDCCLPSGRRPGSPRHREVASGLDDLVRSERAKHHKGNSAHHNEEPTRALSLGSDGACVAVWPLTWVDALRSGRGEGLLAPLVTEVVRSEGHAMGTTGERWTTMEARPRCPRRGTWARGARPASRAGAHGRSGVVGVRADRHAFT
ncbi:transposase domain-containing protein [Streptomyces cyaneochromogenes]|uniref:transposase domain-containing protein n=1 Tax=Streptomyces cyaneochromogenes TaxID=2496836 RepID=UPI00225E2203|nr:transposase domain-containing protein [Streptomyces cyaneochromogenes]